MSRRTVLFARQMRRRPTRAERLLWERLRKRQTGHKWRRQVPMRGYIVDFYCAALKVIVEADGPIHNHQVAYDEQRDAILRQGGRRLIRIANAVIEADPDSVATLLSRTVEGATPRPQRSR